MKSTLPKIFVVVAGLIACLQWSQIAYRLALFYYQCNAERGFNHVEDGIFGFAYSIDAALLAAGIFVIRSLWKNPGFWRACSFGFVLANLAGGITLFNMHRTGVLVGYGEAMQNARARYHRQDTPNDDPSWISYERASELASNFASQVGYTNIHINVSWEDGRFPKYKISTTGISTSLKIIVDRQTTNVGYDYSHW